MSHSHLNYFVDPRHIQITFLGGFLVIGYLGQYIDISYEQILCYLLPAVIVQCSIDKFKTRAYNWKSALITSFSLCLLLKTPSYYIAAIASMAAILSKALITFNGKHVFNPANFGIVFCVLCLGGWISPSQWTGVLIIAFIIFSCGIVVTSSVSRVDIAVIFLIVYLSLLFARNRYLGDDIDIFFHQLQNGALYLFAFFMITDPKTSPNHPIARVIYAIVISIVSFVLQYYFFYSQAFLFSLVLVCMLVPTLNIIFKTQSFVWPEIKAN
jgi:enediyne biosynthesis protein E5